MRNYSIRLFQLLLVVFYFIPLYTFPLPNGSWADTTDQDVEFTHHIDSGLSIRNHEKGHYYPMFDWDKGDYKEFAYWEETDKGSIVDFMNFRVAFPKDYQHAHPNKRYPAIVMLHGTGGSGRKDDGAFQFEPSDPEYDNNSKQLMNPGRSHLEAVKLPASDPRAFPGLVILPQSSYNGSWGNDNVFMVVQFLEWMISEYNVDPDRIVIHGLSNGANGVWKLASERPDLFAAALPMSGVGSDIDAQTSILSTTPVWMFQGDEDSNPSANYSRTWYNELMAKGGKARYTLYEQTGHIVWHKAYAEPDFFSWIRSQNKKNIQIMGESHISDFCSNAMEGPVELGFSAGFSAYQWMKDGQEISGATDRFYTAETPGVYQVKFKRRTDITWDESFALDLYQDEPMVTDFVPELTAQGTTILPYYGEDRSLSLIASSGYLDYKWFKNGEWLEDVNREELILNNAKGDFFQVKDTGSYTVKVIDHCGRESLLSEPVPITFDPDRLLSTQDSELSTLSVYPNPFVTSITINLTENIPGSQQLSLYDQSGKILLNKGIAATEFDLDLSHLNPGLYILVIGDRRLRIVKSAK